MSSVGFSYLLNKKRMPENKTDKVDNESKNIDKMARSLDQVSNFSVSKKFQAFPPSRQWPHHDNIRNFQWIKKMKCSGDTGLGIESFQDIHVGVDDEGVDEDDESYDTVNEEELLEQFLLSGNSLDSKEDVTIEICLPSQTIVSGTFREGDCK